MIQQYANPARFNRLAATLMPWFAWPAGVLIAVGLYFALFNSPPDYQQGDTVRIMYVHVPSAWMALFVYTSMAISSAVGLIWKHPLAHLSAQAAAPIGACFTFVCLLTGSLWGKPMWGTWWVWDARLTSELILLFLYLAYMSLNSAFDDPRKRRTLRRYPGHYRLYQCADYQVLGRLVEYATSTRQRREDIRPRDSLINANPTLCDGGRFHTLFLRTSIATNEDLNVSAPCPWHEYGATSSTGFGIGDQTCK